MAKLTPNLGLFKYDETTDADVVFSFQQALNDNWDILDEKVLSGTGYEVGDIIYRITPTNDSGKHLLDGSLLSGNGIYADFVQYIAGLYSTYPNLFCTESDWQDSISTYGVCGKFVYNSINSTVRLPKITGIVEGTTDVTALGDLVEAGLPNITGSITQKHYFNRYNSSSYPPTNEGALSISAGTSGDAPSSSSSGTSHKINFDASLSNSIYGNSNTVQPQTIQAFIYIVVATSTKTDIQVNIDEIATDLNGKVDKADLEEVQCVVETYKNGSSWYRIWSDGWCEMGGQTTTRNEEVTFLKTFADTTYNVVGNEIVDSTATENELLIFKLSTNKIRVYCDYGGSQWGGGGACWRASGKLATGQY